MPGRTVALPPPPREEKKPEQKPFGPEPYVEIDGDIAPITGGPSQWLDYARDIIGGVPAKETSYPPGYDPILDISWDSPLLGGPLPGPAAPSRKTKPEPPEDKTPRTVTDRETGRDKTKTKKKKTSKRKDGGRGGNLTPTKRRKKVGGPSLWEKFWRDMVTGNNPLTGLPWNIDPSTGKPWKAPEPVEKLDERKEYAKEPPRKEVSGDDGRKKKRKKKDDRAKTLYNVDDVISLDDSNPCTGEPSPGLLRQRLRKVRAALAQHADSIEEPVKALANAKKLLAALEDPQHPLAQARQRRLDELGPVRERAILRQPINCMSGRCRTVRVKDRWGGHERYEQRPARIGGDFVGFRGKEEFTTLTRLPGRIRQLINRSNTMVDVRKGVAERLRREIPGLAELDAALSALDRDIVGHTTDIDTFCEIMSRVEWAEYLVEASEVAARAILVAENRQDTRDRQWLRTKLRNFFGTTDDEESLAAATWIGQDVKYAVPGWHPSDTSADGIRERFKVIRAARSGLDGMRRSIAGVEEHIAEMDAWVDGYLQVTELALGFTKHAGAALAVYDAVVGRSLFTGRELSIGERLVAGVAIGISATGGVVKNVGRAARGTARAGRWVSRKVAKVFVREIDEAAEIARHLEQGYSLRAATRLVQPYSGIGHHLFQKEYINGLIQRYGATSRRGKVLRAFRDSKWNVKKPTRMTQGRFYELHGKLHGADGPVAAFGRRSVFGNRLLKGEGWKASNVVEGLKPYGKLGYIWHGSPTRLRLAAGAVTAGVGGAGYAVLLPDTNDGD